MSGKRYRDRVLNASAFIGVVFIASFIVTTSGCSTSGNTNESSAGQSGNSNQPIDLQKHFLADKGMLTGPRASVRVYTEQAETGDVDAQTRLAVCYYLGSGTPVNKELAKKWFEKSAEDNDKKAQFALGYMLEHGEGGEPDKSGAIKMYMKAAEGHNPYSELGQQEVDRITKDLPPSETAQLKKEVIDWFNLSMKRKTKLEKTRRPY